MNETLEDMGLTISSELIKDDYDGIKGSHTHEVTISRNGKSIKVGFTSGCANRAHVRTGEQPFHHWGNNLTAWEKVQNLMTDPIAPPLSDVLYSLVSDANCVRYGQTFEEFCGDLGYDTDSREAERIYNGCTDEWRKLVSLGLNLDELDELFQDY